MTILIGDKKHTGDQRADEHHRTGARFCPEDQGTGRSFVVGMAVLPALREHADDQERELSALSLGVGRASRGARTTASLSALREELCGGIGLAGARELVCAGGAALRGGSLVTRGHIVAAGSRVSAFLAGTARALAVVEDGGSAGSGARGMSSGREYPTSLAEAGRGEGARECPWAMGRGGEFGADGHRWSMGAYAWGRQARALSAGGHSDRGGVGDGGSGGRGCGGGVGQALRPRQGSGAELGEDRCAGERWGAGAALLCA